MTDLRKKNLFQILFMRLKLQGVILKEINFLVSRHDPGPEPTAQAHDLFYDVRFLFHFIF